MAYHDMRIPGMEIKGASFVYQRLLDYQFPESFTGQRVLDIGSWDGFFAFEVERRGAREVVAIDTITWDSGDNIFDAAHAALKSRVIKKRRDVCQLTPTEDGMFDTVLFLQVLYHMENPLLALQRVRSVCGGFLILETMTQGMGMTLTAHEHLETLVHWPSRDWLERALELVGFRFEHIMDYDPDLGYPGGIAVRTVYHAWPV